ncbi:MAG: DUF6512 family protein [Anaeroplasmataceae bacterium]
MKKVIIYNIAIFVIIFVLSIICHYLYNWTNSKVIGYFTPINESIWEHLKLLFYPGILVLIIELFISKNKKKFFVSAMISISIALLLIVVLYYTITGIIGKNIDYVNISIMIISIIFYLYYRDFSYKINISNNLFLGLTLLICWILLFSIFTYNPPTIGLFMT